MGDYVTVVEVDDQKSKDTHRLNVTEPATEAPFSQDSSFITVLSINDVPSQRPTFTAKTVSNLKNVSPRLEPEVVHVYRLPGERLGFGLKFQEGTRSNEKVQRLFIQSCAKDSPASRVEASWGNLREGDEIVFIDDKAVSEMTRIDCVRCLKDNVAIKLMVRNGYGQLPSSSSDASSEDDLKITKQSPPPPPPVPPRKLSKKRQLKDGKTISGEVDDKPFTPPPDAEYYINLFSDENFLRATGSESDDTASTISTVSTVVDKFSISSNYSSETDLSSFSGMNAGSVINNPDLAKVLKPFTKLEEEFKIPDPLSKKEAQPLTNNYENIELKVEKINTYENVELKPKDKGVRLEVTTSTPASAPQPKPRQSPSVEPKKRSVIPTPRKANSVKSDSPEILTSPKSEDKLITKIPKAIAAVFSSSSPKVMERSKTESDLKLNRYSKSTSDLRKQCELFLESEVRSSLENLPQEKEHTENSPSRSRIPIVVSTKKPFESAVDMPPKIETIIIKPRVMMQKQKSETDLKLSSYRPRNTRPTSLPIPKTCTSQIKPVQRSNSIESKSRISPPANTPEKICSPTSEIGSPSKIKGPKPKPPERVQSLPKTQIPKLQSCLSPVGSPSPTAPVATNTQVVVKTPEPPLLPLSPPKLTMQTFKQPTQVASPIQPNPTIPQTNVQNREIRFKIQTYESSKLEKGKDKNALSLYVDANVNEKTEMPSLFDLVRKNSPPTARKDEPKPVSPDQTKQQTKNGEDPSESPVVVKKCIKLSDTEVDLYYSTSSEGEDDDEKEYEIEEGEKLGPPELINGPGPSEAYFNMYWHSNMLPTIGEVEEEFSSLEVQAAVNGPIVIVNDVSQQQQQEARQQIKPTAERPNNQANIPIVGEMNEHSNKLEPHTTSTTITSDNESKLTSPAHTASSGVSDTQHPTDEDDQLLLPHPTKVNNTRKSNSTNVGDKITLENNIDLLAKERTTNNNANDNGKTDTDIPDIEATLRYEVKQKPNQQDQQVNDDNIADSEISIRDESASEGDYSAANDDASKSRRDEMSSVDRTEENGTISRLIRKTTTTTMRKSTTTSQRTEHHWTEGVASPDTSSVQSKAGSITSGQFIQKEALQSVTEAKSVLEGSSLPHATSRVSSTEQEAYQSAALTENKVQQGYTEVNYKLNKVQSEASQVKAEVKEDGSEVKGSLAKEGITVTVSTETRLIEIGHEDDQGNSGDQNDNQSIIKGILNLSESGLRTKRTSKATEVAGYTHEQREESRNVISAKIEKDPYQHKNVLGLYVANPTESKEIIVEKELSELKKELHQTVKQIIQNKVYEAQKQTLVEIKSHERATDVKDSINVLTAPSVKTDEELQNREDHKVNSKLATIKLNTISKVADRNSPEIINGESPTLNTETVSTLLSTAGKEHMNYKNDSLPHSDGGTSANSEQFAAKIQDHISISRIDSKELKVQSTEALPTTSLSVEENVDYQPSSGNRESTILGKEASYKPVSVVDINKNISEPSANLSDFRPNWIQNKVDAFLQNERSYLSLGGLNPQSSNLIAANHPSPSSKYIVDTDINVEKTTVKDETKQVKPLKDETPSNYTSSSSKYIVDMNPTVEKTPLKDETPSTHTSPSSKYVVDTDPTVEKTSLKDETPTNHTFPSSKYIVDMDPTVKKTPLKDETPCNHTSSSSKYIADTDPSVEKAPLKDETPSNHTCPSSKYIVDTDLTVEKTSVKDETKQIKPLKDETPSTPTSPSAKHKVDKETTPEKSSPKKEAPSNHKSPISKHTVDNGSTAEKISLKHEMMTPHSQASKMPIYKDSVAERDSQKQETSYSSTQEVLISKDTLNKDSSVEVNSPKREPKGIEKLFYDDTPLTYILRKNVIHCDPPKLNGETCQNTARVSLDSSTTNECHNIYTQSRPMTLEPNASSALNQDVEYSVREETKSQKDGIPTQIMTSYTKSRKDFQSVKENESKVELQEQSDNILIGDHCDQHLRAGVKNNLVISTSSLDKQVKQFSSKNVTVFSEQSKVEKYHSTNTALTSLSEQSSKSKIGDKASEFITNELQNEKLSKGVQENKKPLETANDFDAALEQMLKAEKDDKMEVSVSKHLSHDSDKISKIRIAENSISSTIEQVESFATQTSKMATEHTNKVFINETMETDKEHYLTSATESDLTPTSYQSSILKDTAVHSIETDASSSSSKADVSDINHTLKISSELAEEVKIRRSKAKDFQKFSENASKLRQQTQTSIMTSQTSAEQCFAEGQSFVTANIDISELSSKEEIKHTPRTESIQERGLKSTVKRAVYQFNSSGDDLAFGEENDYSQTQKPFVESQTTAVSKSVEHASNCSPELKPEQKSANIDSNTRQEDKQRPHLKEDEHLAQVPTKDSANSAKPIGDVQMTSKSAKAEFKPRESSPGGDVANQSFKTNPPNQDRSYFIVEHRSDEHYIQAGSKPQSQVNLQHHNEPTVKTNAFSTEDVLKDQSQNSNVNYRSTTKSISESSSAKEIYDYSLRMASKSGRVCKPRREDQVFRSLSESTGPEAISGPQQIPEKDFEGLQGAKTKLETQSATSDPRHSNILDCRSSQNKSEIDAPPSENPLIPLTIPVSKSQSLEKWTTPEVVAARDSGAEAKTRRECKPEPKPREFTAKIIDVMKKAPAELKDSRNKSTIVSPLPAADIRAEPNGLENCAPTQCPSVDPTPAKPKSIERIILGVEHNTEADTAVTSGVQSKVKPNSESLLLSSTTPEVSSLSMGTGSPSSSPSPPMPTTVESLTTPATSVAATRYEDTPGRNLLAYGEAASEVMCIGTSTRQCEPVGFDYLMCKSGFLKGDCGVRGRDANMSKSSTSSPPILGVSAADRKKKPQAKEISATHRSQGVHQDEVKKTPGEVPK